MNSFLCGSKSCAYLPIIFPDGHVLVKLTRVVLRSLVQKLLLFVLVVLFFSLLQIAKNSTFARARQ